MKALYCIQGFDGFCIVHPPRIPEYAKPTGL